MARISGRQQAVAALLALVLPAVSSFSLSMMSKVARNPNFGKLASG